MMISKHLLISIFLVTSLFAGSKTKRDKGKSDSKPSSDDSKDIVHKSKWTPREGKLDGEGGKKEDAADEAGVSTEGGNETPKVNRLMENAGESVEEAEHPEESQREDQESGGGAQEEEEGEDQESGEGAQEEEEGEEEEAENDEPEEDRLDEEEDGPKEEPAHEAELHMDDQGVEEPKTESEKLDVDETFSSGAEAPENVDVGDGVDASASPAVETPSSPAETTKYHYSTTETGWEGFKNRDQIEVDYERNGEWYKATILQLQSKPKGTLRIRYENYGEEVINVKTKATIRKRI